MRRERQLLGPSGTRGVASLISGMTLRERRALHEAVKRRIWETAAPTTGVEELLTGLLGAVDVQVSAASSGAATAFPAGIDPGSFANAGAVTGALGSIADVSALGLPADIDAETAKQILTAVQSGEPAQISAALNSVASNLKDAATTAVSTAMQGALSAAAGASTSGATTPNDLLRMQIGVQIKDRNGKPAFEKTKTGWKVLIPITQQQILSLVTDGPARKELERQFSGADEGDEINIPKQLLRDPALANKGNELTFKRSGENYIDTQTIGNDKMLEIIKGASLVVSRNDLASPDVEFAKRKQAAPPETPEGDAEDLSGYGPKNIMSDGMRRFMIGNIRIVLGEVEEPKFASKKYAIKIAVPVDQGFASFDNLFGKGAEIGRRILAKRKAEDRKLFRPKYLKIPTKFAVQRDLVEILEDNFFTATLNFTLEGDYYIFYDRLRDSSRYNNLVRELENSADEVSSFAE